MASRHLSKLRRHASSTLTSGTDRAQATAEVPNFFSAAQRVEDMVETMAGKHAGTGLKEDFDQEVGVDDVQLIRSLAMKKVTRLSLRDLHSMTGTSDANTRIKQAQFLHREVPTRFAQRAVEMWSLPYGLSKQRPVVEAAGWYGSIVKHLVSYPKPVSVESEAEFANFLASLLLDHACVPRALSQGVLELKRSTGGLSLMDQHRIDKIMDNFFTSRISLRFLIEHYIASRQNRPGYMGIIHETSPIEVALTAADDVTKLCKFHLGRAPDIKVFGQVEDTLTAVPNHLYYIMCELLKNSCRATCMFHKKAEELPPVRVIVAKGREDMTIKVMDEGGGIKRSDLQHVWSYMFSTAPTPDADNFVNADIEHLPGSRRCFSASSSSAKPPSTFSFAGYGMGLPLSRLYAQHFGGSLKLRPMEGYGTDAYLHMHRLKVRSEEKLPCSLRSTFNRMGADGRLSTGSRAYTALKEDDKKARTLLTELCLAS